MRYTVNKSIIWLVGQLWMSGTAAQCLTLDPGEVEDARDSEGRITRGSLEFWLDTHAGDFAEIIDFSASIEADGATVEIGWADEESEWTYADCMSAAEDD